MSRSTNAPLLRSTTFGSSPFLQWLFLIPFFLYCSHATLLLHRNHYQEAIEIYKKELAKNKENHALDVYIALCYYKLDYYDVSQVSE